MASSEYNELKEIGRGSYGTVWLISHRKDGKKYVMKKIDLKRSSAKERNSAEQEAKLLSQLKHPNIVSYRDSFERDGTLHIIMGFCECGDLYGALQEYKSKRMIVDEPQVVQWFIQIAMGLQYLHERNILHRDLKTQNIFLTNQRQVIKVGDLGIARVLNNTEDMAKTFTGTPYYMSPEVFSHKPYNHKSDVWAFGICVYEMATLDHAFSAKDLNTLAIKVVSGRQPPMPTAYSHELVDLIRAMLHRDPDRRPSILRILQDPFVRRNIQVFLNAAKQNTPAQASAKARAAPRVTPVAANAPAPAVQTPKTAAVPVLKQVEREQPVKVVVKVDNVPEKAAVGPVAPPRQPVLTPSADQPKVKVAVVASGGVREHAPEPAPVLLQVSAERTPAVNKPDNVLAAGRAPVQSGEVGGRRERQAAGQLGTDESRRAGVGKSQQNVSNSERTAMSREIASASSSGKLSDSVDSSISEAGNTERMERNEAARRRRRDRGDTPASSLVSTRKYAGIVPSVALLFKDDASRREMLESFRRASGANRSHASAAHANSYDRVERADQRNTSTPAAPAGVLKQESEARKATVSQQSADSKQRTPVVAIQAAAQKLKDAPDAASHVRPSPAAARVAPNVTPTSSESQDRRSPVAGRPQLFRQKSVSSSSSSDTDEEPSRPKTAAEPEQPRRTDSQKSTSGSALSRGNSNEPQAAQPSRDPRELLRENKRWNRNMKNMINALECTVRVLADETLPLRPLKVNSSPTTQASPQTDKGVANRDASNKDSHALENKKPNVVENHPAEDEEDAAGPVAEETIGRTGRIVQRFAELRKEIMQAIGFEKLKKAYDILDQVEEEEIEPKLITLLGRTTYDTYIAKIWQVKYCEEALYSAR